MCLFDHTGSLQAQRILLVAGIVGISGEALAGARLTIAKSAVGALSHILVGTGDRRDELVDIVRSREGSGI